MNVEERFSSVPPITRKARLDPMTPLFFAHESAFIEDGSSIGTGTKIWHNSHIRAGAVVGTDCVLGKNVFVDTGASVGNRVKIQNNVSVYAGVTVEDEVFVGPSAVFTNDRVPRAFNPHWTITDTAVRRGASIGANATIVCGNAIGEYAMVAAGSTVVRPVEPHQLVAGNPARTIGWVCRCGAVVSRAISRPDSLRCESCSKVEVSA